MIYRILLTIVFITFISCGAKQPSILGTSSNPTATSKDYEPFFDISEYAPNTNYGYSEKNPIKVGGVFEGGVMNQRRYLASLAGPSGELVSFHRRGSCCPYKSKNGFNGTGMLDIYEVTYEGLKEPVLLYISLYDQEKLYIPKGFTRAL